MEVRYIFFLSVTLITMCILIGSAIVGSTESTCQRLITEDCASLKLTGTHYKAAVVEYKPYPIGNQAPKEAVLKNVRKYVELMGNASAQHADIIVFPELGLTTTELPGGRLQAREFFVQIPSIGEIPCDKDPSSNEEYEILHELSCAARVNKIYTVINLGEYEQCNKEVDSECPNDGAYQYNTNVAFDRNGAIVARYRKYHLYFEPAFNYPPIEYVTFSTDFGVEFGLFTCFDIIFANPGVELVASRGIRNFIFPTAWVDELPFLTAIQAQSLWAQSNGVNLLASGYHKPEGGKMGSGIYSGRQNAKYVFDPTSGTKLIISDVPLNPEVEVSECEEIETSETFPVNNNANPNHFWLREDLTNCTYKTIDPTLRKDSLCYDQEFCCEIEYDLVTNEYAGELKLIVFDGRRTVAAKRDWFEWQVCGIIHCLNNTIESCTENISPMTTDSVHPKFRMLNMHAKPLKLEYDQNGASRPAMSLLDTNFRLIPPSYFHIEQSIEDQENSQVITVSAKSKDHCRLEEIDVKTIAVIQRVYSGRK